MADKTISTPITEMFGIKHPVILAGEHPSFLPCTYVCPRLTTAFGVKACSLPQVRYYLSVDRLKHVLSARHRTETRCGGYECWRPRCDWWSGVYAEDAS